MSNTTVKKVNDLGAGAYLMMHGFKVAGRQGRTILFEVENDEIKEFEQTNLEYLSGPYHQFDSCLMSLKKISEYSPAPE
jgi:hypothetical protein